MCSYGREWFAVALFAVLMLREYCASFLWGVTLGVQVLGQAVFRSVRSFLRTRPQQGPG
jgi:hypothetical protein